MGVREERRFVADPENGHALHTWGVAVDATLVDAAGHEVPMPSDFDSFSPAAALHYQGNDETVRRDLNLLLHAMGAAGFKGMSSEWWHFVAPDWSGFRGSHARAGAGFQRGCGCGGDALTPIATGVRAPAARPEWSLKSARGDDFDLRAGSPRRVNRCRAVHDRHHHVREDSGDLIPMRQIDGHRMLGDLSQSFYPGQRQPSKESL